MPKPTTFPTLFDECRILNISDLCRWNYVKMNTSSSGTINWRNQYDEITSRLPIQVIMNENKTVLILNYKCNDNSYNYVIQLTSIPSNLGMGVVWYFICPFTWKRCRKLHLLDERFMHRSALPSGMYSKQTHSKKWRNMEKIYGCYFDNDEVYRELYSKNFKRFYKGKPTKRYLKLMRIINQSESIPHEDIERLIVCGI